MPSVEDQRAEDKGREARNHGVFISNREIYDRINAVEKGLGDRIRAIEIKVWGILVPAGIIAVFIVRQVFFSGG